MSFPISDEFNDPRGRWNQNAPWDDDIFVEHADATAADFLATQEHVNVRSFREVADLVPVPQDPDLDDVTQDPYLDNVLQTELEIKPGISFSENWVTDAFGGLNENVVGAWDVTTTYTAGQIVEYRGEWYIALGTTQGDNPTGLSGNWGASFFVGKLADKGGWSGLRGTTDGTALSATFRSSIPGDRIDISNEDSISVVFPDWHSFTAGSSYIQFTSSADGTFGGSGDSAQVLFSANTVTLPELRIPISAFAAAGFDNTQINGVKVHVEGAPAASQNVTMMAIRAVTDFVSATVGVISDGTNVGAGDTITLHDVTYRFEDTMAQADDVQIGATSDDTLDNLRAAVNQSGTPGTEYFAGTTAPTGVTANARTGTGNGAEVVMVADISYGDSANSWTSTEASTHLTTTNATFAGGIDGWTEAAIDLDTRWNLVVPSVTLDGSIYAGTIASAFEFIRGDGTANDPFPVDGAYTIYFYPGGETSPNDASGATYNRLAMILRETKDSPDVDGSAVFAWLFWQDDELRFEARRRDMTAGVETDTTLYSEIINNTGLNATTLYAWTVNLTGKTLSSTLHTITRERELVDLAWALAPNSSNDWTFRNGRVGFMADLITRDAYVDALIQSPTGYAFLRTLPYESRTPVDGARLQAVYSPDANLFISLTGTDAYRDQTKTLSGYGSIRTQKGVTTNQFVVDDWHHTYLDVQIWVGANVTSLNEPKIVLIDQAAVEYTLDVPAFQPAQWNHIKQELRVFQDLVTGNPYRLSFLPGDNPDVPLGFFWIDSVTIGRRKVAWSVRADPNNQFRNFYGLVNDPGGAVHFNPDERGRFLQLQAEALTPDAWVSQFSLFPHYAELGLPLYDQAYETR